MARLESQAREEREPQWRSAYPSEKPISIVRSSLFSKFSEVVCGISTRIGGVSPEPYGMNTSFNVGDSAEHVSRNRQMFLNALGFSEGHLAIPEQQHTANVRTISNSGRYDCCDALVTDARDVVLSVTVADCAPIFLFDRAQKVIACVHAGWRGTEQRIAAAALKTMNVEFGCDAVDVLAFIGSSAGSCCYEVGDDVAQKFDKEFVLLKDGRKHLDIKAANVSQLRAVGIPAANIEIHSDCTICNPQSYHSYRRDREKSGRMMGVIGLSS